MDIARTLFDDFNYYRNHTGHVQSIKKTKPYFRDLKATPDKIKLFQNLSEWCLGLKLDSRLWVYTLFVTRRWLFTPRLLASHLQSENHIPKYKAVTDFDLYRLRISNEQSIREFESGTGYDPNRDINNSSESAKRAYVSAGNMEGCMDDMLKETFGYHPLSKVCVVCLGRAECRLRLQANVTFDIMALRRGEITSVEARTQAVAGVQSYGR